MPTPLVHNPANGVTGGLWRTPGAVHKLLTRRHDAPTHWAASDDPRHWNYWRREALVHESALPGRLELAAPHVLAIEESDAGIELIMEDVEGRHGEQLDVEDVAAAAFVLGRAQGGPGLVGGLDYLGDEPWLSHNFLADYSGTRLVDWPLLYDDAAWEQPLIARHFGPETRAGLVRLRENRPQLLAIAAALPRVIAHLDAWPNNLIVRPDGEIVFLDWAFTGDGALGEDASNLVPDAVMDLLIDHARLDELAAAVEAAYLAGLHAGGWDGDPRLPALGIRACAVKYDWLTVLQLQQASQEEIIGYGGAAPVDVEARYAARGAALALCARWGDEALALAADLGLTPTRSSREAST
jgi:Phosphotransferase enzyme family